MGQRETNPADGSDLFNRPNFDHPTNLEGSAMTGVNVTAIERVIDIFEAFQTNHRPMSLTDLSEALGIPRSTPRHRLDADGAWLSA